MKKFEAISSIVFRHYLKANYTLFKSCSFEIKSSRGKLSFPFAELKEEQVNHALANKSNKGNLTRVATGTVGASDYHFFRKAQAYVVIFYPNLFTILDIDILIQEKTKSLSRDRACEIATQVVHLK